MQNVFLNYEFFESSEGQNLFHKAVVNTNSSEAPFSLLYLYSIRLFSSIIGLIILLFFGNLPFSFIFVVAGFLFFLMFFEYKSTVEYERKIKKDVEINRNLSYLSKISRIRSFSELISYYRANRLISTKYDEEFQKDKKNSREYLARSNVFLIIEFLSCSVLVLLYFTLGNNENASVIDYAITFVFVWQIFNACSLMVSNFFDLKKICKNLYCFYEFCDWKKNDSKSDGRNYQVQVAGDYNEITVENISFCYQSNKSEKVLSGVSFKIKKGEKIGLLGVNGAGKTTLVKLLLGLYSPSEGGIYIDGTRLSDKVDPNSFFGCVFQEEVIIPGTVRENILMGRSFDKDLYEDAVRRSGLKEILDSHGYSDNQEIPSVLSKNGIDFSGGEVQHLYFARCLYKNAPFFIFDEPTAALDPLHEFELFEQFNNLTKSATCLFISHRSTSVKVFDRIVVMDNGKIIEEGTFSELMEKDGMYAKMYNEQANYYNK